MACLPIIQCIQLHLIAADMPRHVLTGLTININRGRELFVELCPEFVADVGAGEGGIVAGGTDTVAQEDENQIIVRIDFHLSAGEAGVTVGPL